MPQKSPTPPPVTYPSVVVSRDGIAFYVQGLRIPGTRQELRLKEGDSLTWLPLQVAIVRFTGPIRDTYRSAIIFLTGGEKLQRDVFVDFLIEGTTDIGYWNMSMIGAFLGVGALRCTASSTPARARARNSSRVSPLGKRTVLGPLPIDDRDQHI